MNTDELRLTTSEVLGPRIPRLQSIAMAMAAAGLVLCGLGFVTGGPQGFFSAYLYAYVFWVGVSAGSLGLLMLHHTVGGGWGFIIRRFLEAATSLPVFGFLLLMFLGVVAGIPYLYGIEGGWAHASAGQNHILHEKAIWLNVPGFCIRTVIYFAVWMGVAHWLHLWGNTQDERADAAITEKLNRLGAAGLLLYVLTITFLSVDWVMSLSPLWFSSIFGLLFVVSQGLSTLALMLVLLPLLAGSQPLLKAIPDGYFRDLGNLMLAFVLLWAYMAFSQYLITFSGNTAEEAPWYIRRQEGGWQIIPMLLIALHFALPFLVLLLGTHVKRDPFRLRWVAGLLVIMRFVDLYWLVAPTFRRELFSPGTIPADLGAPLLIGGIWLWLWAAQLKQTRMVVPLHDPRFDMHWQEGVAHG